MRLLLIIAILFLTGCAVPDEFVRNEEKTRWENYGDEWWIQGMEIDVELALRRVDMESDL